MNRPDSVPAYAEEIDFVDCLVRSDESSRFAPGMTVRSHKFCCPACKEPLPEPQAHVAGRCPSCDLHMLRHGALVLFIWREPQGVAATDPRQRPALHCVMGGAQGEGEV